MCKDDLLDYELHIIKKLDIYYFIHQLSNSYTCGALPDYQTIIINSNYINKDWLPFAIGHEIGHLVNGDNGICYFDSYHVNANTEHHADLYSLALIYNYCRDNDIYYSNPQKFITQNGIPQRMQEDAISLFMKEAI